MQNYFIILFSLFSCLSYAQSFYPDTLEIPIPYSETNEELNLFEVAPRVTWVNASEIKISLSTPLYAKMLLGLWQGGNFLFAIEIPVFKKNHLFHIRGINNALTYKYQLIATTISELKYKSPYYYIQMNSGQKI